MKFEKRIVVFLDILGFGSLVEAAAKKPGGDEASRLRTALTIIQNLKLHLPDIASKGTQFSSKKDVDLRLQIFSDSVIMSIMPDSESVEGLLTELGKLYVRLMIQGIYIRGGITYGKISNNKVSPCGPAVNGAYRLESQIADTPRIVLGQSLVNYCRSQAADVFENGLIKRNASDGVFALDPIGYATSDPKNDVFDLRPYAQDIADHLNRNLEQIVDQPKHYQKISALADEWSTHASPNDEFFDQDFRTKGFAEFVDGFGAKLDSALDGKTLDGGNLDIESLPETP